MSLLEEADDDDALAVHVAAALVAAFELLDLAAPLGVSSNRYVDDRRGEVLWRSNRPNRPTAR